jgi:hypothetical protein
MIDISILRTTLMEIGEWAAGDLYTGRIVEPMITLRATDNWIEFTVRYVVDYRKRRWMKDYLFTRILEEIDKSNNQIRLASATFELVPGSTIDVHLSRSSANQ